MPFELNLDSKYFYNFKDVKEALDKLEIKLGSVIFIHSSLKKLGKCKDLETYGLQGLLDQFLFAVGPDGTIVVPTFNFDFCQGKVFDSNSSPSVKMGAFCEFFRNHAASIRSNHPIQSVSSIGTHSQKITVCQISQSAFSDEGCFSNMLNLNADILFWGSGVVESFFHIAEERAKVSYRYWKRFNGGIKLDKQINNIEVDFFARRRDMLIEPIIDINKIYHFLKTNNLILEHRLGTGHVMKCNSNDFVNSLYEKLLEDENFFLKSFSDPGAILS